MPAYLWHLNILQLGDKSLVTGTILSGKRKLRSNTTTIAGNFWQILRSYFHPVYSQKPISFKMGDLSREINTTSKGHFSFMVDIPPAQDFQISAAKRNLEIPDHYPTVFEQKDSRTEVISDLDDTVMVSHTASALKRISTILFYRPKKRRTIANTHALFKEYQAKDYRICYLSKSESNLFGLITSVISYRDLPRGALLLTPFLRFSQLFDPKKGKDYKLDYIRRLIVHQPDKKFILIGDDTQRDMDVYTKVVGEFPEKIEKVYIRQTSLIRKPAQTAKWEALLSTGVNAVYFQDSDEPGEENMNNKTGKT